MLQALAVALVSPSVSAVHMAGKPRGQRSHAKTPKRAQSQKPTKSTSLGFGTHKKDPVWQCIQNCGACCKLDKGPAFPSPGEIFDDPSDVELYKSLIGVDGWCIHYEKSTRKCSIYADRPYFCRVELVIFEELYGIGKKKFHKEACRIVVPEPWSSHSTTGAGGNVPQANSSLVVLDFPS